MGNVPRQEPSIDDEYGVLKTEDDPRSKEEIVSTIARQHPIELDERIDTLGTPLVVECACPGWQPDVWPPEDAYERLPPNYTEAGDIRYPAVPCSVEGQAEEIVAAADAGCAAAHVHPRDPEDCLGTDDTDLLAAIYDRVYDDVDVVSVQHSWELTDDGSVDYVTRAEEKLSAADGSNRYIQGGLVLWPTFDTYPKNYTERVQEGVEFYQDNDIKPVHKIRSQYDARRLHRDLVQTGVMTDEPYVLIHDMGHPFGWPMDQDPWMPMQLFVNLQETKERFPGSVLGVASGGRNWLPITLTAILAGVDYVRVGIEDFYWTYPHRDDVIRENMAVVGKVVDFCEMIGRELATPEQARRIMGITRT